MNLLIIPDAHAHPGFDNDRFDWLGNFILDSRPDAVLCLGDLADMPSLSSYDKGTKGFEGRRYAKDVFAAIEAQDRMWYPVRKYNRQRARNKAKQYQPFTEFDVGNHEDRINRAINAQPELEGTLDLIRDLNLRDYWQTINEYKSISETCGFFHSHFLPYGLMGRPIGGEHVAASLVVKQHQSCIVGHNHVLDFSERTGADGKKLVGISAGCYVHPEYVEGWNANTAHMWWRGVVLLEGANGGYYNSVKLITQRRLKELYG